MSNPPLFSIIIPCYNQGEYLAETLDSVLAQTFCDFECIIINDGSTDNSEEIIDYYCQKDERIKKLSQHNQGLSQSRNNGIIKAKGSYILPLDGDDKIGYQYLELAKNVFENSPQTKLVYCKAEFFGTQNEYWELPKYKYETLLFVNCIFCSAIFKKEDYLQTEGYDPNMRYGYEDWEFWLQLLNKEDKVVQIDSINFFYRRKDTSMISFIENKNKLKEMEEYVYKKHQNKFEQVLKADLSMAGLLNISHRLNKLEKLEKTVTFKTIYKLEKNINLLLQKLKKS